MPVRLRLERLLALLVCCVENLLHGGLIFGWPSLVFVLKDSGYFDSSCPGSIENVTTAVPITPIAEDFVENVSATTPPFATAPPSSPSCSEQDAALQLIFSVTTAIQTVCMFPVGLFFDRFGTRISRLLMTTLLLLGYMIMGFSSRAHPYLLYPAAICFTIAGVILLLSSIQTGNLFESWKSTTITTINSLYSASVVVFLLAKVAYDAGFSINIFFFIFAGSTTFLTMNSILFYPINHIPWPLPKGYRVPMCQVGTCFTVQYEDGDDRRTGHDNRGYVDEEGERRRVTENYQRNGEHVVAGYGATAVTQSPPKPPSDEKVETTTTDHSRFMEDIKRRKYRSLRSCLCSPSFALLLVWQTFLELDMLFTFGSLNTYLTRLAEGDDNAVSWYTNVFSITQFFVVLVGPLGGLLLDRHKFFCRRNGAAHQERASYADMQDSCLPLALTTLSSIIYSGCMLIPSLPVQYLSFVFILILRSLLYGVGSAVVAILFPMRYFASAYGALRTISGCFSFLQYPIFMVLQQYLSDDPFYIIVAFIAADTVTLLLPMVLYVKARRMAARASNFTVTEDDI